MPGTASSLEPVLAALTTGRGPSGVDADGFRCCVSVCRVVEHGGVAGAAGGHSGRAAATFEAALCGHGAPTAVTANQCRWRRAANVLGQNTLPAIAATEFDYLEMWALLSRWGKVHMATLCHGISPPVSFSRLPRRWVPRLEGVTASAAVTPVVEGAMASVPTAMSGMQSLVSQLPGNMRRCYFPVHPGRR